MSSSLQVEKPWAVWRLYWIVHTEWWPSWEPLKSKLASSSSRRHKWMFKNFWLQTNSPSLLNSLIVRLVSSCVRLHQCFASKLDDPIFHAWPIAAATCSQLFDIWLSRLKPKEMAFSYLSIEILVISTLVISQSVLRLRSKRSRDQRWVYFRLLIIL